jgi:hypothetical protein
LAAMRDRADARGFAISGETSHAVAGLSDRRLSQIMSIKTVRPGRNVRRIGIGSLGPVLGFLGCELWLVEDPAAMKLYDKRLEKRMEIKVQRTIIHHFQKVKTLREMGRKGGLKKFENLRAKRGLAKHQRHAGIMRWQSIKDAAKPAR